MAEITTQRTGEILRKLFEFLRAAPNGIQAKEALANLKLYGVVMSSSI
jgi:restriction system protein